MAEGNNRLDNNNNNVLKYDDTKFLHCGMYKSKNPEVCVKLVKLFTDTFEPKDWATLAFLLFIKDFKISKDKINLDQKNLLSLMNQRKLICLKTLESILQLIYPALATKLNNEVKSLYTAEDIALDEEFEPLILSHINMKCAAQKNYPSPITTYQNRYEIVRGLGQSLSDEKLKKICDRYASEYRLTTVELKYSFSIYQIIQILFENDDFYWNEFSTFFIDAGLRLGKVHFI